MTESKDSLDGHIEQAGRSTWFHLLILTASYVILHGTLAWTIPQFEPATHNDDWVYVPPAKHFFETGTFQPHPIAAALALPQIVAGGGIFHIAGEFRYGLLRDVMVVFGVLPIGLMWTLSRQLGFSRTQATWGALLLMVNPLVVSLTWSFQTEVPFLTFALAGWVFLLKGEGATGRRWAVLPACCAFLLMSLTRQTGLCLVAAAVFYLLIKKRCLATLAIGLVIPATLFIENYFTAHAELIYHPYTKHMLVAQLSRLSGKTLFLMLYEGIHLVGFLGVFSLPLVAMGNAFPFSRRVLVGSGLIMAVGFLLDSVTGLTPVLGPYLRFEPVLSLGPKTLEVSGSSIMAKAASHRLGLTLFRFLAAIGGAYLLGILISGSLELLKTLRGRLLQDIGAPLKSDPDETFRRFLILLSLWATLAGVLLTSVVIGRRPFDQYLMVALPLSYLYLWTWSQSPQYLSPLRRGILFSSVFVLGIFSILGTTDYWQWNAARWQAIARLESQGLHYRKIDGGYAYNGLHANLSLSQEILNFHQQRGSTIPRDWYENQRPPSGDVFIVGFSPPRSDEQLVFAVPYKTPLSRTSRRIYVKKHVNEEQPIAGSASSNRPESQIRKARN